MRTFTSTSTSTPTASPNRVLEIYARRGLWALPVWAGLLFYGTFTHQPDYKADFGSWARYVTTTEFLASHLVASIVGAAIGILGFVALAVVLAARGTPRRAMWALATGVLGTILDTAVFGIAAFAQPAIGRSYLAGETRMPALYDDVNGVPLVATAAIGVVLLSIGLILYGSAVARTRLAPPLAGVALIAGGPLFSIVGLILGNFVQSIGVGLLVAGTVWIAWSTNRESVSRDVPRPIGSPAT